MDLSLHKIKTPPCSVEGWPEDVYVGPMCIEEHDAVHQLRAANKPLEALALMVILRSRRADGARIWTRPQLVEWRKSAAMVEPLSQLAEAMLDDDLGREAGDQGNRTLGDAGV